MRNERIGDYLVSQGLLTEDQLRIALEKQKEAGSGKKFGDVVAELGFMNEVKFTQALSNKLNVQYVDLDNYEIDSSAVEKIPEALARKHTVIAIAITGKRLTVATNDPVNFIVLEDIKVSTGMDTRPVLATLSSINKAINKYYNMQSIDDIQAGLEQMGGDLGGPMEDDAESKERVENAPIVKLATTIVENSYRADATDIHIEPFEKYTRIRIRVNGDLIELMNISSAVHSALTTRMKLISGMNIAEKRIPQDGRFTQVVDGTTLDVRVSSLPMVHGEKIVIRILSTGQIALRKITDLGMSEYNYQLFESMLRVPHGVILVTGPTGSGKTTTLYAALGEIAKPHVNVVTVEDPVEKAIDGINQCQVNQKAGMTFAAALRSILRQDPDIVMIGEMRDTETADIGIRAAITGHLVLSTLHTNDAASTVVRLVDMGVAPYMVATSLIGVIAQRLVKRLCPECKKARLSTPEEDELMGIAGQGPIEIYEPGGCTACNNTGYRGRTAIHEIIHCTAKVSQIIAAGGGKEDIEKAAKANGTKLLRDNAAELVKQGISSIDELVRTTFTV
ncbi:MAG: Flp pilus assembly complex ATPase component TadA [Ruminococcus sp.]|nr:Flp pilus assembly complex ATPase component TadA [Ruminococcus sp.]